MTFLIVVFEIKTNCTKIIIERRKKNVFEKEQ